MPGESPTKWQAQAYRFGVRRLESAVASGDPLLRGDPVRRRLNIAVLVSIIVAVLVLGAFTVYGFVRPDPKIGTAAVVIDSDTGGVYVSRNGLLYPAMNLSSALLAAGRGASGDNAPSRTTVNDTAISEQPRGPLLGIPGAPNVLPSGASLVAPRWTICDLTTTNAALPPGSAPDLHTTALLGPAAPAAGAITQTRAMLVTADKGAHTYLVWDGRRSRIDVDDSTIRLAFGFGSDVAARPISAALLNTIPEAPDIVAPTIDTSASSDYTTQLGVTVGEVFGLQRATGAQEIFVALPGGYQQVTPLVGDLIRDEYDQSKQLPLVEPVLLRQAPRVADAQAIDLDNYPTDRPSIVGYQQSPAVCVARSGTSSSASVFALGSVPLPKGAKPVTVTTPGSLTADDVYVAPGHGAVFSSTTGTQQKSARALFLVTDDGVAYPVVSALALTDLGYAATDVAATAPDLISLLPQGPSLDPDAAARFYPQTGGSARSLPSPTAAA